jgi:hypothetical protein
MRIWLKKPKVKDFFKDKFQIKKFQISNGMMHYWNLEFFYLEFLKIYSLKASQPRAFKAILVLARVIK